MHVAQQTRLDPKTLNEISRETYRELIGENSVKNTMRMWNWRNFDTVFAKMYQMYGPGKKLDEAVYLVIQSTSLFFTLVSATFYAVVFFALNAYGVSLSS